MQHDRSEWIHTLANINNTPTQVQRGQRAIQNGKHAHLYVERNCLYDNLVPFQLLWKVRVPGFFLNSLNSSLPELGLKLYNIIAVRKLSLQVKYRNPACFFRLLYLHSLSLSPTGRRRLMKGAIKWRFAFNMVPLTTLTVQIFTKCNKILTSLETLSGIRPARPYCSSDDL